MTEASPIRNCSSSEDANVESARSQDDEQLATKLHNDLAIMLDRELDDESYARFRQAALTDLGPGVLSKCSNVMEVFQKLHSENIIDVGDYKRLREMTDSVGRKDISEKIEREEEKIQQLLGAQKKAGQNVMEGAGEAGVLHRPLEDVHNPLDRRLQDIQDKSKLWQRMCKQNLCRWVETHVYRKTKKRILGNDSVIVLAGPGEGKSAILQKLSMDLAKEGYLTIFLRDPQELKKYFIKDQKIVFIFDDPFGGPFFLKDQTAQWHQKGDSFFRRFTNDGNVKFLFASRKLIWSDCEHIRDMELFQNHVDVSSEKLKVDDKQQILRSHFSDKLSAAIIEDISHQTLLGFPECCRLISTSRVALENQASVLRMFQNPFASLCNLLRTFTERSFSELSSDYSDIWKYAVLVLVLLSGGRLSAKMFNTDRPDQTFGIILKKVLNACSIQSTRPLPELRKCAEKLCGALLTQDDGFFKFYHDSIYEAIFVVYGESNQADILDFCEPGMVVSVCRPAKSQAESDENFNILRLREECYAKFVKILTDQARNSCWFAFRNPAVQDEEMQTKWIEHLQSSWDEPDLSPLKKNVGKLMYYAAKSGAFELLKYLSDPLTHSKFSALGDNDDDDDDDEDNDDDPYKYCPFVGMAAGGHAHYVKTFLDQLMEEPQNDDSTPIGHIESLNVEQLIVENNKIGKRELEHGLIEASREGNMDIVELLLPHNLGSKALEQGLVMALTEGHLAIKTLLSQHIVPTETRVESLKRTSRQGDIGCVKLLLRENFTTDVLDERLKEASLVGQIGIVLLLLQHYHPATARLVESLKAALSAGHTDIVKLLYSLGWWG